MELDFETELIYEDVDLYEKHLIDSRKIVEIDSKQVSIKWRAIIYYDKFGIVSVFPGIDEIDINVEYEIEEPDEKGYVYQSYTKKLNFKKDYEMNKTQFTLDETEDGWKYRVEHHEPTKYGDEQKLKIRDVEIDFEQKEITINF